VRSARTGRRFDQLAGAGEPRPSCQPACDCAALGDLDYGNTAEAKEAIASQIPAQSPSDRSEIKIKNVPVSGQLSAVGFSNASSGSPQAPRDRILLSTRFPPSGVQKFHQHNIYLIALHCKCQEQAFDALLINDFLWATWAPRGSGLAGPSRRAPASPSPPMDPQHGHSLDPAGALGPPSC
jgi:hypothetical protein